jgi:hypothetical protein
LSVPDEGCSKNTLCALNLISTFLFQMYQKLSSTRMESMTIHKIKCHYSWKDGQCRNRMCNINMRSLTTSMISMRDNDCFISTIRRAENFLKDVLWNIATCFQL